MKMHPGIVSGGTLREMLIADFTQPNKKRISKQPWRWTNPGLDLIHVFDPHCDCY